jgi:bacteriorhodopsin
MTGDERFWYQVGATVMVLGAALFLWMARGRPKEAEAHYVAHLVAAIASALAYLTLALGQGVVPGDGGARGAVVARHLEWAVTLPALLFALASTALGSAARRPALVVGLMLAAVGMALCALAASLSSEVGTRWVWFAVSYGFLVAVLALVWGELRREVEGQPSPEVARVWYANATLLSGILPLYPFAWALGGRGAGIVDAATEALLFLGLDVASRLVFGVLALQRLTRLEPNADHYRAIVATIAQREPDQAPEEHALREHVRRERSRRDRLRRAAG